MPEVSLLDDPSELPLDVSLDPPELKELLVEPEDPLTLLEPDDPLRLLLSLEPLLPGEPLLEPDEPLEVWA